MKHPTCKEIAANEQLWNEYANPSDTTPFDSMSYQERLDLIHEVWPGDCNCNDDDE